ncbi:GNAT family N-acetyltransferase [Kitasatospora sp. NPDC085879]|uniref:GNAT family N-acetyltransferase n=1 Tax=Kitasatospora sp. NPDC085879 TaxID=3154769 RepID=UPI00344A55C6
MLLRELGPDDWPLWRDLRLAALTEAPHAFTSRLADWDRTAEERWRARIDLPGSHHLAALLDGRPVGLASGMPGGPGAVELRSLWVAPEGRGRGVGGLLITGVERWATASGATVLNLAVLPGNTAALALYRRHGFVDADEPGRPLPDGTAREHLMRKPLPPDRRVP